jgi:hypothetical protein
MTVRWDQKKRDIAAALAEGKRPGNVALEFGLSEGYIRRLKQNKDFMSYVDELTMTLGLATAAERVRIAKAMIEKKLEDGLASKKDVLEWMRYLGEETGHLNAQGSVNITMHITQQMQQVPAAERPAAMLNLARGLVLGLNTVPGIVRQDPDIVDTEDAEKEVDLIAGDGGEDVRDD